MSNLIEGFLFLIANCSQNKALNATRWCNKSRFQWIGVVQYGDNIWFYWVTLISKWL